MKTFFNVEDLGDLKAALAEAQEVKANRFVLHFLVFHFLVCPFPVISHL